jgi:predicted phosphoribosyltransferase/pimeloyl-ACP methyl ester carboxylesterase
MSEQSSRRPPGAVTSLEGPPPAAPGARGFSDRRDAGRRLAALLEPYRAQRPVVVGIPRGGVPVAAEVARALDAPLDVTVVRKIGAPQNPEYAIGALAEGGVHVLSGRIAGAIGLSEAALRALLARAEDELEMRLRRYRGIREPIDISGRTVILVDDGLATGRSARAAVRSLRKRAAARVVLAVPVAAPTAAEMLRDEADEVVCVATPDDLWSVGQWYEDFAPTADEEVMALLHEGQRTGRQQPSPDRPLRRALAIPLDSNVTLNGELSVPIGARGIVAFAHGSGSSRLSPRNRAVAQALGDARFATLLFDLLTPAEEVERTNVFDISLLASRLVQASAWLRARGEASSLPLAYFGASTGAAAALTAAAELGDRVQAVVSRGGRPDLARDLGAVRAPTLLIVGGADYQVLALNREAQRRLRCPNELAVVPGATHLFEEPGALEQVGRLAIDWLDRHLVGNHEIRGDSI